jgi:hypothetical protein
MNNANNPLQYVIGQIKKGNEDGQERLEEYFRVHPDSRFLKDSNGRHIVFYIEQYVPFDLQFNYYYSFILPSNYKNFSFNIQDKQGNTVLDRFIISYIRAMQDNPLNYKLEDFRIDNPVYYLITFFAKYGAQTNHLIDTLHVLYNAQNSGRLHPEFKRMTVYMIVILNKFKTDDPTIEQEINITTNNPSEVFGNINNALTENLAREGQNQGRLPQTVYRNQSLQEGLSENEEVPSGSPRRIVSRPNRQNPTSLNNNAKNNTNILTRNLGKSNSNNILKSRYRQAAFNAARTARSKSAYPAVNPGNSRRNRKTRRNHKTIKGRK